MVLSILSIFSLILISGTQLGFIEKWMERQSLGNLLFSWKPGPGILTSRESADKLARSMKAWWLALGEKAVAFHRVSSFRGALSLRSYSERL